MLKRERYLPCSSTSAGRTSGGSPSRRHPVPQRQAPRDSPRHRLAPTRARPGGPEDAPATGVSLEKDRQLGCACCLHCLTEGHTHMINSLVVTADGGAAGECERGQHCPPVASSRRVTHGYAGGPHGICWLPRGQSDGTLLASGGQDGTVRLWRLPDGVPMASLDGGRYGVRALAITPDGTVLASGGLDAVLRLWRLPDGVPTASSHASSHINCLAAMPDGRRPVSGGLGTPSRAPP